jgi:hypothetical protein
MTLVLATSANPGSAAWLDASAIGATTFSVHTTGWSNPITVLGVLTDFNKSLVVPADTVTVGKVMEIEAYVDTVNGDGGGFAFALNGVPLLATGYPIKYSGGAWPMRMNLRLINVGPTLQGGGAPVTDVLVAIRMEYYDDIGAGARSQLAIVQYEPFLSPLAINPALAMTLQPSWINDGPGAATTYLRYMSARILG